MPDPQWFIKDTAYMADCADSGEAIEHPEDLIDRAHRHIEELRIAGGMATVDDKTISVGGLLTLKSILEREEPPWPEGDQ